MKSIDFFKEMTQVPRPSKHEEKIGAWLEQKAKGFGWASKKDKVGNILISVPGAGSGVGKPTLVLQGHMDMVCEKNPDVEFDFMTQGLNLYEETEADGRTFLKAKGTTLGADNGAGVALSFYCGTLPNHPPLEILVTTDEETGMTGASQMERGFFTGKRLINMDSHIEGEFCVGCAGGGQSDFTLKLEKDSAFTTAHALKFEIDGLLGGHSGVDIHEGRASANVLVAHQLKHWLSKGLQFRLTSFHGGSAHNAIARSANAVVCFASEADRAKAKECLLNETKNYPIEVYTATATDTKADYATTEAFTKKAVDFLNSLVHGVIAWSEVYKGYVETSANVANIRTSGDAITICYSYRSFKDDVVVVKQKEMTDFAAKFGVAIKNDSPYPGWPPAKENPLLDTLMAIYKEKTGKEPFAAPVHAGLECGYMEKLCPGMKAVSMGPVIYDLHAPTERLEIDSMRRMEELLVVLMERL